MGLLRQRQRNNDLCSKWCLPKWVSNLKLIKLSSYPTLYKSPRKIKFLSVKNKMTRKVTVRSGDGVDIPSQFKRKEAKK